MAAVAVRRRMLSMTSPIVTELPLVLQPIDPTACSDLRVLRQIMV